MILINVFDFHSFYFTLITTSMYIGQFRSNFCNYKMTVSLLRRNAMAVSFTRVNDPFNRIHNLILSFEKSREKFRVQEK